MERDRVVVTLGVVLQVDIGGEDLDPETRRDFDRPLTPHVVVVEVGSVKRELNGTLVLAETAHGTTKRA